MKRNSTYRTSALVLAVLFCLFNIGLPIVVSACPMMKNGKAQGSCCVMKETLAKNTVSLSRNSSCCRTVVAANRNTTEFLQSSNQNDHLLKIESLKLVAVISSDLTASVLVTQHIVSDRILGKLFHPLDDDIPILISSLLI